MVLKSGASRRALGCGRLCFLPMAEDQGSPQRELMSAWAQEARAKGMTNPGEIFRYARQKEISIHGG